MTFEKVLKQATKASLSTQLSRLATITIFRCEIKGQPYGWGNWLPEEMPSTVTVVGTVKNGEYTPLDNSRVVRAFRSCREG